MRILCATDLLPKTDAAIERAARLSEELDADLTLLHVVTPGESPLALEEELLRASADLRARVRPPRWRTRVPNLAIRAGNAGHLIGEAAARSKADLVVLGPHSKRPLRDVLEGTIAAKTLVSTAAPVLVVRAAAERAYGRVLLALDISEASASAIRAAETFVLTDRADATVVHAHTPPYEGMLYSTRIGMEAMAGYAENWSREATRSVRTLLKRESDDVSRYDIHIEHGPAAPAITKTVERFAPDLLVLGTGGVGRLRRALIGSVANRVLHESTCDVLIVPTGWSAAMSLNPASYRARTS